MTKTAPAAKSQPLEKSVSDWIAQSAKAVESAESGSWEQIVHAVDARATRIAYVLRDLSPARIAKLAEADRMALLEAVIDPRVSFKTEHFVLPAAQKLLDSLPLPQATIDAHLAKIDAFAAEVLTRPTLAADRAVWHLHDDAGRAACITRATARLAEAIGLADVPEVKVVRQVWSGYLPVHAKSEFAGGRTTLIVNIDESAGARDYDAAVLAAATVLLRHQQSQVHRDRIDAIMTHKSPPLPADPGERLLRLSARCPHGYGSLRDVERRPHEVLQRAMHDRLVRHLTPGLFHRAPKSAQPKPAKPASGTSP